MEFVGTGRRLAQGDVGEAARELGVETAVLLAFLEVEARGRGFDSKNRPTHLFEPHVMWRNTKGAIRQAAVAAGVAYRKWVPGNYPRDSYPRLRKAINVAREPGFRSGSYGLPQILGENHRSAGFASAEAMFIAMKQGEREQLLAMVTLLKDWGLAKHLRGKDFTKPSSWVPAVKRYNGSGYARHGYHKRCAKAYIKHAKGIDAATGSRYPTKVVVPTGAKLLVKGMKGEAIRNLQADLAELGHKLDIDGRFGDETYNAVMAFQRSAGLVIDGKAGDETKTAIAAALEAQGARKDVSGDSHPENEKRSLTGLQKLFAAIVRFVAKIISKLNKD